MIIIKNTTANDKTWGGKAYSAYSQYAIQEIDRLRLLSDEFFLTDLANGAALINDGNQDFSDSEMGLLILQKLLVYAHEDVDVQTAVGLLAPAPTELNSAAMGYAFDIDDKAYLQFRLDQLIGEEIKLQVHLAINNTTADRWVAFECFYRTTNGFNDKVMNTHDGSVIIGPIQVPTTAYRIFAATVSIPASVFANGEHYVYLGLQRIDVSSYSKTNTANNPHVLRCCKLYYKRLDL